MDKLNEKVASFLLTFELLFSAQIVPPWASTMFFDMYKPRPMPISDFVANTIVKSIEMVSSLFAIVVVVLVASSAVLEIGIMNVSYAQVATPRQNPMCDPSDKFIINTTESHVCGVPKTPLATPVGPTTAESPSSPKPITPPSGNPAQEAPIPGLP